MTEAAGSYVLLETGGIVVVDRLGSRRLGPIPAAPNPIFRGTLELFDGHAGPIAAE